jgi:hypothetical protein
MKYVEGRTDIVKDDTTGAVLNIDHTAYQAAVNASKLREASKQQLESNTNDINSIKSELSEIKTMLRTLIDGR